MTSEVLFLQTVANIAIDNFVLKTNNRERLTLFADRNMLYAGGKARDYNPDGHMDDEDDGSEEED